jgi:hypothetical protein
VIDLERGPANFERFVLIIDGLQCGCCEGGVSQAVRRIHAIRYYEFELDTNSLSIEEVIKRLNVKTGYTFSEYTAPDGQVLDLLATSVAKLEKAGRPFGVTRIETPEKPSWHRTILRSGRYSEYYFPDKLKLFGTVSVRKNI